MFFFCIPTTGTGSQQLWSKETRISRYGVITLLSFIRHTHTHKKFSTNINKRSMFISVEHLKHITRKITGVCGNTTCI